MSKVPSAASRGHDSPAQIQAAAQALFTRAVAVVTLVTEIQGARDEQGTDTRLDLEATAHPKRRAEFAAGRAAAQRALAMSGSRVTTVHRDVDGAPRWPPDWLGSISHTAGHALAVVARAQHVSMLGVDLERLRTWRSPTLALICTRRERAWLADQRPPLRDQAATLLFSAKEAFYKAQHPVYGQSLDFLDVELEVDPVSGRFCARPTRRGVSAGALEGRFLYLPELVLSGVEVLRSG